MIQYHLIYFFTSYHVSSNSHNKIPFLLIFHFNSPFFVLSFSKTSMRTLFNFQISFVIFIFIFHFHFPFSVSNFHFSVSNTQPMRFFQFPVSSFQFPISSFQFPVSSFQKFWTQPTNETLIRTGTLGVRSQIPCFPVSFDLWGRGTVTSHSCRIYDTLCR